MFSWPIAFCPSQNKAIATVMCVAAAVLDDDSWVSKETLGAAFLAGIGWLGVLNFAG